MPKTSSDRHKDHSRQYNARVPIVLLDEFNALCLARDLKPAVVVRALMQGFVDVANSNEEGRHRE